MKRRELLLAVAVVLAANAWALIEVGLNRAGQPDAVVELTEREAHLVRLGEENTGLALRLVWADLGNRLDRVKLKELGFKPAGRQLPKEAFVVLDRQAERLAAIDVGRDAATLRRRYADGKRFIVTRCMVRAGSNIGDILQVLAPEIHVPLPYSRVLAGLSPTPSGGEAKLRFQVTLCYGRHYEPWISDCRLLKEER
jgi:hypothetical protein